MRPSPLTCALFILCAISLPIRAAGAVSPDSITLTTGDTLTGLVVAHTNDTVTLKHPTLGVLTISRGDIAGWTHQSAPSGTPAPDAPAIAGDSVASGSAFEPAPEEPTVKWSGHVDLGANGASGNSDTNNISTAFGFKRKATLTTLSLEANYRVATDNGATTTNRFFDVIRYDRTLSKRSRWSYFAQTSQEADEFKDYDFRLTGSGGMARQFVDTKKTTLKGYAGLGAAREFGGSDSAVMPFALLGTAYSRKLNRRMTFRAGGELEPRFDNVGEYRLRGNASLAVDLNDTGSLKFKLGLEDEFDSDPGLAKKNDFYYTASVVYSF